MGVTRKFLDWREPALSGAVDWLVSRYRVDRMVDLDETVVAFPGSRAGRRFLEILVRLCDERQWVLVPPQIKTVGQLPELLYEPQRPFAGELVQQLAWVHALRAAGRRRLARVVPALPDEEDVPRWLELGRLFWKQHREMAAEGLNFQHVVDSGWRRGGTREKNRWKLLQQIQRNYLDILDHFQLWDLQTARLFAIEHNECRSDRDIVLVGAADMPRALRLMLDQVSDRVTALVFAPDSHADRFDRYGCIDPDAWAESNVELDDESLVLAEGPAEQAECVVEWLDELESQYRADEVVVGVPDPTLAPQIERRLTECGVATRFVVGKRMSDSAPYRLLSALADYLDRGRFEQFAGLVRHPDLTRWIDESLPTPSGWLSQLDEYYARRLPPRLDVFWGDEEEHDKIREVYELVEQLIASLGVGRRKLADWATDLIRVLSSVYGGRPLDRDDEADHYTLKTFQAIQESLVQYRAAPAEITPSLTSTQAIRLLLDQLAANDIASPANPEAIELLGWLELPLDNSPAAIITSFNEGFIPTSVNSDLFLPDGLRRKLGMLDNRRRFARDAYALSMLAASREQLRLVVARRDRENDPLSPSRLLFAADLKTIARRSQRFFRTAPTAPTAVAAENLAREKSEFVIPRPDPNLQVAAMSVTSFRSYLACPYRFYLRHVLHLDPINDDAEELDGAAFGSLLHDVLNLFGRSKLATSDNADHIRSYLQDTLRKLIRGRYGRRQLAPVNVQAAQMSARLEAFARWQAEWRGLGWEIAYAETPDMVDTIELPLGDGRAMTVRGRIDRIDRHPDTGQWIIFDYKTSDTDWKPEQTHQRRGEWVDLQLPLYRRFAEAMQIEGDVRFGYLVLPKDTDRTGQRIAEWTVADLDSADEKAIEVASNVLDGVFWPPADPPPRILTDYAAICQESAYEKHFAETTESPDGFEEATW